MTSSARTSSRLVISPVDAPPPARLPNPFAEMGRATQKRAAQLRKTRSDTLRRATIRRRMTMAAQSPPRETPPSSPAPGTLSWVEARQVDPSSSGHSTVPAERPEFYTREAAAKRLGVGKTTIWELTRRGLIGVAYIGSKPLIPAAELDRYIASLVEEARERAAACYRPRNRG
jgi:excisionase family DNA binding protein